MGKISISLGNFHSVGARIADKNSGFSLIYQHFGDATVSEELFVSGRSSVTY